MQQRPENVTSELAVLQDERGEPGDIEESAHQTGRFYGPVGPAEVEMRRANPLECLSKYATVNLRPVIGGLRMIERLEKLQILCESHGSVFVGRVSVEITSTTAELSYIDVKWLCLLQCRQRSMPGRTHSVVVTDFA